VVRSVYDDDGTLAPGTPLGRYRVLGSIARGGMGGVWEVEDGAGKRYALKSPLEELGASPVAAQRFAREVNALRLLDHPNLVSAVDAFVERGRLFLVMEHVEGVRLSGVIAAGALAPRRALVIARQLLGGLGHAHAQGIAHRDLKPDNIMLVEQLAVTGGPYRESPGEGTWELAKLIDFGLVKLVGDAPSILGGGKLTRTGMVAGTPAYMAPEQALGRELDGRCDLYALGLVVFEMLTGRPAFDDADPIALMRKQVKQPPPRLDQASGGAAWATPAVVALVEGALVKEPDHRFPTAAAMTAALDHAFASIDHLPGDE
jgi:serine/threonine protein kinase